MKRLQYLALAGIISLVGMADARAQSGGDGGATNGEIVRVIPHVDVRGIAFSDVSSRVSSAAIIFTCWKKATAQCTWPHAWAAKTASTD